VHVQAVGSGARSVDSLPVPELSPLVLPGARVVSPLEVVGVALVGSSVVVPASGAVVVSVAGSPVLEVVVLFEVSPVPVLAEDVSPLEVPMSSGTHL